MSDNPPTIKDVRKLWERSKGKAFEPKVYTNAFIEYLLKEGWMRRCDMRCMFEAFRDTGLAWTGAAKAYFELEEARKADAAAANERYWDNMDRC